MCCGKLAVICILAAFVNPIASAAPVRKDLDKAIAEYLQRQHSPLSQYAGAFVASGRRHNIDPRLVVAITGQEEDWGKSYCAICAFNAWAWLTCRQNHTCHDPVALATATCTPKKDCTHSPLGPPWDWPTVIEKVTAGISHLYLQSAQAQIADFEELYCVTEKDDAGNVVSCDTWVQNVSGFYQAMGGSLDDLSYDDGDPTDRDEYDFSRPPTKPSCKLSIDPSQFSFDAIKIGRSSILKGLTIRSNCEVPTSISSIDNGSLGKDFCLDDVSLPLKFPPHGTKTIRVAFCPKSIGERQGMLALTASSSARARVTLKGTGVSARLELVDKGPTDFGAVRVNAVQERTLSIRNLGDAIAENVAVRLVPRNDCSGRDFTVVDGYPDKLGPMEDAQIHVRFRPVNEGSQCIEAVVESDAIAQFTPARLSGTGTKARLVVEPVIASFGAIKINNSSSVELQLKNTGTGKAESIEAMFDPENSVFSVGPGIPDKLEAGGSVSLQLRFMPVTHGPSSSQFSVKEREEASNIVRLDGVGNSPKLSYSPVELKFGGTKEGHASKAKAVVLTNIGDADLIVNGCVFKQASNFRTLPHECTYALPPQKSASIHVQFAPKQRGLIQEHLVVSSDDLGGRTDILLSGTGGSLAYRFWRWFSH